MSILGEDRCLGSFRKGADLFVNHQKQFGNLSKLFFKQKMISEG